MKKKNFNYSKMDCAPENFLIPEGYELVPIGTTKKKSYFYINSNIHKNGSKDIKQWVSGINSCLIGEVIEETWYIHIRKKRAKPIKNINAPVPHILPEKLVHITLTPVQAFIYWKLLGTVSRDEHIKWANNAYKTFEIETIQELKSAGVNPKALFDQIDNGLKNLGMSSHDFINGKIKGEVEKDKYLP